MIPEFENSGLLPRGRFVATPDEVKAHLVGDPRFAGSATRDQVWDDFETIVELLRRKRVKIPAAFVGGSFVTATLDPGDVDAAIFVDVSRITSPATLTAVKQITDEPKKQGLQVDSFVIPWFPDGTQQGGHPAYTCDRGSWDDFWQRHVAKADRVPPQRSHAIPVRGYLEVILDGYV